MPYFLSITLKKNKNMDFVTATIATEKISWVKFIQSNARVRFASIARAYLI